MPRKATGAQIDVAYVAETVWGTTPSSPAMKVLRCVSEDLDHVRGALVSEELKAHRQIQNVIHGTRRNEGNVVCEYNKGLEDILEAALYGSWTSNVLKLGQILKQFTIERRLLSIGWSMRYTGIRPDGLSLEVKPEGIAKITFPMDGKAISTAADGLGGPSGWLVNNAAGYAAGVGQIAIDTGATNPAALDQFVIYQAGSTTAMRSDQIYEVSSYSAPNLNFTPNLDVAILDNDILHFFRPATAVSNNDPMNSFNGTLQEGGAPIAIVTGLDLAIGQGAEPAIVIGANAPQAVIEGGVTATGKLSAYVENLALFDKFLNETYTTLQIALTDGTATHTWLLPKIKYTGAKINKPAGGGPVFQDLPFQAVYDATEATTVKITRS